MGGDFNLALGGDEFEHLVGDDFNCVALRLDLDLAFGGECGDAFALGEQAEAFGHTGDQAFAHAQVGVFAGGEGDVLVAHEVGGLGGGQCHARR